MTIYNLAVIAHIGAGTLALTLFWIAALMQKGTSLHRRVGQGYLLSMLMILVTGVPLVFGLLARGQSVGAVFLTYLLVLVGNGCWSAWRAIRERRDYRGFYGAMFWTLAGITAVSGLAIVVTGLALGSPLLSIFGSIGVIGLVQAGFARRRAPHTPNWWLREHYTAMIGNGVATHIAFFSIGLRNAFPGVDPSLVQNLAWFLPLGGAVVAGVWLNRRYGKGQRRSVPAADAPA